MLYQLSYALEPHFKGSILGSCGGALRAAAVYDGSCEFRGQLYLSGRAQIGMRFPASGRPGWPDNEGKVT